MYHLRAAASRPLAASGLAYYLRTTKVLSDRKKNYILYSMIAGRMKEIP